MTVAQSNILEMAKGAIMEQVDIEVGKIIGNILDLNTAPKKKRTLSLSVDFIPSAERTQVVVRKGIALKDSKIVKPIVKLKPYRTFLEVDQPESEFLLRLHDGMRVALYEADGGAWKLQARTNVADYLKSELAALIEQVTLIIVE